MEVLLQVSNSWLWVFVPRGAGVCTVAQLWPHSGTGGFSFVSNRSRGQEAAEHGPEEHRDRAGRGDEELDDSPGEPGVHGWEHEQLQLWGKVSSIYSCGSLTFLHGAGGHFSVELVFREKHTEWCRSCSDRIPFTSPVTSPVTGRVSHCWCWKEKGQFCCAMRRARGGSHYHDEMCQEGKQVHYIR